MKLTAVSSHSDVGMHLYFIYVEVDFVESETKTGRLKLDLTCPRELMTPGPVTLFPVENRGGVYAPANDERMASR